MEFVSWVLSLFGLSNDSAAHQANQRAEVYRLAAEVSGDAGRALDIIALATPRLSRRCAELCPDDPAVCQSMTKVLEEQRNAAAKIMSMADDYKKRISTSSNRVDWARATMQFQEWRSTVARIPPWVEGIVQRYEAILDDVNLR